MPNARLCSQGTSLLPRCCSDAAGVCVCTCTHVCACVCACMFVGVLYMGVHACVPLCISVCVHLCPPRAGSQSPALVRELLSFIGSRSSTSGLASGSPRVRLV